MKVSNELRAGVFIVSALLVLGISVFTLGREREIFSDQEAFYTAFNDVKGLAQGAPVRLGGITIGRVDKIGFSSDLTDQSVHITLLINNRYLERIREDSLVTIETQGLLGDRFLNMNAGKGKELPPGSPLKSFEGGDVSQILNKASVVVDNTVEISENLNNFLRNFSAESLGNIGDASRSIAKLATEIEKGDGVIHKLIYPKKGEPDVLDNLTKASKDISGVTSEIKTGDGILHALVYEKDGKETVKSLGLAAKNLSETAASLTELADKIKNGDGILHSAIYNKSPNGIDDILKKLDEAAGNLRTASKALSDGSGTIGALLVDSKLYDNLVEVTDGAKRSFILRQAIKSSMNKPRPQETSH